jgi:hypothetical protein
MASMATGPRSSAPELDTGVTVVYVECPSCHHAVAVVAEQTGSERFIFCVNCLHGWDAYLGPKDNLRGSLHRHPCGVR